MAEAQAWELRANGQSTFSFRESYGSWNVAVVVGLSPCTVSDTSSSFVYSFDFHHQHFRILFNELFQLLFGIEEDSFLGTGDQSRFNFVHIKIPILISDISGIFMLSADHWPVLFIDVAVNSHR